MIRNLNLRSGNRQGLTLAATILLPLLILGGLQLYQAVNARRLELEGLSRQRADEVMRLVDSEVSSEFKLARVLASATSLKQADVPAAYARAREFVAVSGSWRSVRLSKPNDGLELFDLRRPLSAVPRPARADVMNYAREPGFKLGVGSVVFDQDGLAVIPLQVPVIRSGRLQYVLTIEIDPASLQRVASARFPPESIVGGVVDRDGRFVARSLDYRHRVGRPGSAKLRSAVRRGGSGFYENVTLEGARSYTSYVTSPLTGWSTHVAVAASPFDAARYWSIAIWIGVALGCLALSILVVWLTLRDMAQGRKDEDSLRQAQKMEAIGHLTGGIAHDFNNLLTAIIGGLDLVLRRTDPQDRSRRYIEGALDAAYRAAKLTSRLLAFSRTERLGVTAVDVKATLDGMSDLLDQSLGPTITVRVSVEEEARWVSTDHNQLELALLNIAVNARDAMPEGGVLTFSARRTSTRRQGKAWPCVEISVSDTGEGMDRHVLEHAFDPFFTTKGLTKGTGLGLAQVYAFAHQTGGDAKLESECGVGTQVRLFLPLADEAARASLAIAEAPAPAEDSGRSGKRILVLDDDDSVRLVIVENLRARGYVVFEATDGEDALSALSSINPDLFMLDFVMPGLNGAEVARRAREMRPDQKLLIVSGHMDKVVLDSAVDDIPILRKPFDGPTLARRVALVLAPDGSPTMVSA